MKILTLSVKKQWFDMIVSGMKTCEYRELTAYWRTRLFTENGHGSKGYTHVKFINGYGRKRPYCLVELLATFYGYGNQLWGAPADRMVYVLRLGRITEKSGVARLRSKSEKSTRISDREA